MKKIMFGAVMILFMLPTLAIAQPDVTSKVTVHKKVTVAELVKVYATQYGVSEAEMLGTMKCESSLNPNAVGDHGKSYGLSQIYLPAHPDITKAQATDPRFASEFMAKEFAKGNKRIWTCARNLGYT